MSTLGGAIEPSSSWLGYRCEFGLITLLLLVPIVETLLLPRHAGAAVAPAEARPLSNRVLDWTPTDHIPVEEDADAWAP